MRRYRDLPIAQKALALGIVPAVCAVLVVTASIGAGVYRSLRSNLVQGSEALLAVAADNMSAPLSFNDPATATQLLRSFRAVPTVDRVCVFDLTGRLFASYAAGPSQCPASDVGPLTSGLEFGRPVVVGERRVGVVQLAANTRTLRSDIMTLGTVAATTLLVVVLAVSILADRMQRAISTPIAALVHTVDRVSATADYSLRAERKTSDETGRLVTAFNEMLVKVEQKDRVKDEFLATLSHELRTPLNAILGWLQVIQRTGATGPVLDRAIRSVERNAQSQQRVVEDLLDISRIVTGKLQMTMTVVDLRDVLAAAVEGLTVAAAQKGVGVHWVPPVQPCLVSGDAARLQQVFSNVLANSLKFTPKGGSATAEIRGVDGAYTVEIRDTGIGIDPAFLAHIFERFRQADSSPTREQGGLGLGLAIVKEIVDVHGGAVTAESAGKGAGATFKIMLPQLIASDGPRVVV